MNGPRGYERVSLGGGVSRRNRSVGQRAIKTDAQATRRTNCLAWAGEEAQPARVTQPGIRPPTSPASTPRPIPDPKIMLKPEARAVSVVTAATTGDMETAQMENIKPPAK